MAETISTLVYVRGRRPSVRAIALAVLLGLMAGFVHGWNLSLVGLLLLVVFFNVRARLFIGVWGVGVALSWLLLPFSYMLGRFVLDSTPVGGIFGLLNENPVVPLFGLDRYTVVGGGILALVLFVPIYLTVRGWVRGLRARIDARRKSAVADDSGWPTQVDSAVPKRRPRRQKSRPELAPAVVEAPPRLVRRFGAAGLLLGLSMTSAAVYMDAPQKAAMQILNSLAAANGAEVTAGQIGLDFWTGRLEIRNLAFADPANLNEDRVLVDKVAGLVDTAALMCGRLEVDLLRCEGIHCHVARSQPAWGMGGGFPDNAASPFDAPRAEAADDQPGFAVDDCVAHSENLHGCVANLRQVLTSIEHLQESDRDNASDSKQLPRFAELPAGRSLLGAPRPKVWIRSMVVEGFDPEIGWGSRTSLRFANLSNNAGLCPRATYLEIQSPEQGLKLRTSVAQGERPFRHSIQLRAEHLPLAACSLGTFADRGLVCDGGTASVSGEGWIDDQSLELKLVATDHDLKLRLSDERPVPGLTPEAFDARLDQVCRLRFAARVHGLQSAPKMTFNVGDLREYVDRRSRLAIDIALAAAARPPVSQAPVPVEVNVVSTAAELFPAAAPTPEASVAPRDEFVADPAANEAPHVDGTTAAPIDAAVAVVEQATPPTEIGAVENDYAAAIAEANTGDVPAVEIVGTAPVSMEGQTPQSPVMDTAATDLSQSEPLNTAAAPATESELVIAQEGIPNSDGVSRLPPIVFPSSADSIDSQSVDIASSTSPIQSAPIPRVVEDGHEATPANTASFTFSPPANQPSPVCETPSELPARQATARKSIGNGYPEVATNGRKSPSKSSWWNQRFEVPTDLETPVTPDDVNAAADSGDRGERPATFGQWARTQFTRASNAWPFRKKDRSLDDPMTDPGDEFLGDELEQPRLVRQPEEPRADNTPEPR